MATPSYTTDLQSITPANDSTGWAELTNHIGGSAAATENDYFIQGTGCVSQQCGNKSGTNCGLEYDYGSDLSGSITAGKCVFFWHVLLAGNAVETFDNGGLRLGIGSTTGNIKFWKSGGSDFGRNPYGGWYNAAIDPTYTADYTEGTPGSGYRIFGGLPNLIATVSKGYMHAFDAIRYGRGELKVEFGDGTYGYGKFNHLSRANDANDISFVGDTTNASPTVSNITSTSRLYPGAPLSGTGIPASTFVLTVDSSTQITMTNNATATNTGITITSTPYNRWGLFQAQGVGFLWKGLISFGNATNACDFRDSNRNITIDNTPRTYSTFNKVEFKNSSSRVDWNGITFSALSSVQLSRGNFEVVDAGLDLNLDNCNFNDCGTFIFKSNSTINNTAFRRTQQITLSGGGTLTSCVVSNCTDAVSVVGSTLNDITDCSFTSDGSNHAVDLGTIASSTSMNWDNLLSGYAVSDGSTGNEAIKVNVASSQVLTINVGTGYSTPSIYNTGPGTVSVVSGQVTTKVTVKDLSTGSVIDSARVLLWATDASNKFYNASISITGSGTTATVTHTGHGLSTGDYVIINGANEDVYNGVYQVTVTGANNYTYTTNETITVTPATGTILAKWAIISGLTNASGIITDTRSFSLAQPIAGWVRKSTSSPYYQQGPITGSIDTGSGFSVTIQLVRDE